MLVLKGSLLAIFSRTAWAYKLSYTSRFTQWFQQFADNMDPALRNHCMSNYTEYVTQRESADHPEAIASRLIACLLDTPDLNEATKANMASAQVLLGLLPTILSTVGCEPEETSMLGLRRPLLALLVTVGSPAMSLTRSFVYRNPIDLLKQPDQDVHVFQSGIVRQKVVVGFQIFFTLIAVANTVELALELGYLTVTSFAPTRPFLVALWTVLGVVVHGFGTGALHLRMRIERVDREEKLGFQWFAQMMKDEFSLCSTHTRTILRFKESQSAWFIFVTWFAANGTTVLILYGTLVFSSLMFISTLDAVVIVLRYLFSAVVCRAILMHELNGMRIASREPTLAENGAVDKSGVHC